MNRLGLLRNTISNPEQPGALPRASRKPTCLLMAQRIHLVSNHKLNVHSEIMSFPPPKNHLFSFLFWFCDGPSMGHAGFFQLCSRQMVNGLHGSLQLSPRSCSQFLEWVILPLLLPLSLLELPLPPFSTLESLLWSLQQTAHCASPDELLVLHNDHVPCHDDRRTSWRRMKGGRSGGFGGGASTPKRSRTPFPSRRQRECQT